MDDFATHDATLDLLQLLSLQKVALDENRRFVKELSEQRKELRETNAAAERTNRELAATESKYKTVVESLHEVVFRCDNKGRITLLNPAWEAVSGIRVEDSIGKPWSTFVGEAGKQRVRECMAPLFSMTAREATFDMPIVDTNGSTHYCEISVHTNIVDGVLMGMSGTMRDITERRLAQLEMMVRDDLMASVAEAMRSLLVSHGGAESFVESLKVMGNALAADRVSIFLQLDSPQKPFASWTKAGCTALGRVEAPQRWQTIFARGERVEGRTSEIPTEERAALQEQQVHAFLAVPVIREGRQLGYIRFDYCHPERTYEGCQQSILELFCSGVAGRITRNEAERGLVESELRKAKVLESALDCVITIDAEGAVVDYNPAAERTFGYLRAEVIGRNMAELIIPPTLHKAHSTGLAATNKTGKGAILGQRIEVPALRKDGQEICIELSVVRIEVSGRPMYTAYLRDITETKRTVARLRLLESVSVNARDPVLIVSPSTSTKCPEVRYVNEAFTLLTGYSADEVVGKPVNLLRKGLDSEDSEPLVAALTSPAPVSVELMLPSKQGPPIWVEVSAAPVHNEDGSVAHHIGLVRDFSQQKQTTAAMRRARDLAEEANRTKSQFLANMSHELRTPLNAVIGFSQILARKMFGPLNGQQSRYVNSILTSGRHLLQLINDILDLSKVESGRVVLERKRVAIPVAIDETLAVVATLLGRKSISLEKSYTPDLPAAFLDEPRFKQVMYNLLSNAIKFTQHGGRIKVSATLTEASEPGWNRIQVRVQDSGVGIKPEDQERIFNEFEQVDSSYTREQEGTGLGLALVAKFTRLHGGDVFVESSGVPGEGSCFRVDFPVDPPGHHDQSTGPTAVLVTERPEHSLRSALEGEGFSVLWPRTHEQGLQYIADYQPQIVLLGPQQRALGSLRFIESLREVPATATTPVILFNSTRLSEEELYLVSTQVQATTAAQTGSEIIRVLRKMELGQAQKGIS